MKTKTLIFLFIGIIILAGGAYLAGQLFNQQSASAMSQFTGSDGTTMVEFDLQMTPAPELPVLPEIASGIFTGRADNIITMNEFTSNAMGDGQGFVVSVGEDGSIDTSANNDMKQTEVMITSSTVLYRDITDMEGAFNNEVTFLQQKLEEGNLDDFNSMTFLTVWGRENGDRIIADTILYSIPNIVIE